MNIQSKRSSLLPRVKQQYDAIRSITKEKIISAGLQLFSTRGLAATSIQDIANLAGISMGLMYHYYKSKEDLFTELVETAVGSAAESTRVIFNSDRSPAEKIRLFSKEVIDSIAGSDQLSQLFLLMIHYLLVIDLPEKASRIQELGFAPLNHLKRTIFEGQALGEIRPGNPDEMVVMYYASIQGLAISRKTMGDRFVLPNPDFLNGLLLKPAEE
jgi:AcrR family transcriptional regulator